VVGLELVSAQVSEFVDAVLLLANCVELVNGVEGLLEAVEAAGLLGGGILPVVGGLEVSPEVDILIKAAGGGSEGNGGQHGGGAHLI